MPDFEADEAWKLFAIAAVVALSAVGVGVGLGYLLAIVINATV